MSAANRSSAVMAQRHVAPDGLDLFPTPPWAVRGFVHHIVPAIAGAKVWEPAAGRGHMVHALQSLGCDVFASDIFGHPHVPGTGWAGLDAVGDFQCRTNAPVPRFADGSTRADWIITNPPFNAALAFVERALERADNVAVLCRTAFVEGKGRYNELFTQHEPALVAVHAERVPMCADVWDPKVASATSYSWFVWRKGSNGCPLVHVPPGCRTRFTLTEDLPWAQRRPVPDDDQGAESGDDLPAALQAPNNGGATMPAQYLDGHAADASQSDASRVARDVNPENHP